jgi:hypothetical protein
LAALFRSIPPADAVGGAFLILPGALGRPDTETPVRRVLKNPPSGEGLDTRSEKESDCEKLADRQLKKKKEVVRPEEPDYPPDPNPLPDRRLGPFLDAKAGYLCSVTGSDAPIADAKQNRRVPREQTGASQRTGRGRHTPPMSNRLPEIESIPLRAYAARHGAGRPQTCSHV